MIRAGLLAASRSTRARSVIEHAPGTRSVVARFVAGEDTDAAVRATSTLRDQGLLATIDYLGEDTTDRDQAAATVDAYLELLTALAAAGLTGRAEASVKLTAIGLDIDRQLALDNLLHIAGRAHEAGTTITVDMEDHTRTSATLDTVLQARQTFPTIGAVVQAYLHRTLDDLDALLEPDSRVRLCKGAYRESPQVAYQRRADIDDNYRRAAAKLLAGGGYPMFATHDPTMIAALQQMLSSGSRDSASYEMQMLLGVRSDEQRRLAAAGHRMRVYVPYGDQWYGYLMRRLAEKPSNLAFFLRAVAGR